MRAWLVLLAAGCGAPNPARLLDGEWGMMMPFAAATSDGWIVAQKMDRTTAVASVDSGEVQILGIGSPWVAGRFVFMRRNNGWLRWSATEGSLDVNLQADRLLAAS